MRPQALILLLMGLLPPAGPGGAAPTPAPATAPASPTLLRDDPLLQQKITLEATDRPLGEVLKDLSPMLKVDLSASSQIADQRVTLRLTGQPLYLLLNRLPQLLSHLPEKPHGYYWEKLGRPANARPAFNLWRDLRSLQDEEYARDYPRREAARMLRDMRDVIPLTAEQRREFKSDYPPARLRGDPTPLDRALQNLSDAQIEALVDGEKMPLDPAMFAGEIAAFKQKQRADSLRTYAEAIRAGYPPPEPPDVPPALSVERMDKDGTYPNQATEYEVKLEGVNDYGNGLEVYDTNTDRAPNRVPPPIAGPKEPVFDLAPLLTDRAVTPAQRKDVGFTLQALAKVAHVTLCQEDFIKAGATAKYDTPGPTPLKGTLPQLIAGICREWDLHTEKVGDDYVFWSRTWALDRANDVPDRLVARWRARLQKQGTLTLEDNTEIAATLTWPQVKLTLDVALAGTGPWSSVMTYKTLRLIGLLPPLQREAAFSADGLALTDLSPWVQQAFAADFRQDFARVPADQLDRARLTFQMDRAGSPDAPTEVVIMYVRAGGRPLFGSRLAIDLPAPRPKAMP